MQRVCLCHIHVLANTLRCFSCGCIISTQVWLHFKALKGRLASQELLHPAHVCCFGDAGLPQSLAEHADWLLQGESAGGLTMGAALNMRADLFSAVIMSVPFLDVLTTMLDDSIPLTIIEKEVWGDPNVS